MMKFIEERKKKREKSRLNSGDTMALWIKLGDLLKLKSVRCRWICLKFAFIALIDLYDLEALW